MSMLRGKRPEPPPSEPFPKSKQPEDTDTSCQHKCCVCMRDNLLTILTISSIVLGGGIGAIIKELHGTFTPREIMYIEYTGDIFLRMLKSLIIPLIVSSLVSAIASLDITLSKRIAARCFAFYLTTTFVSVLLGILLVLLIQPGKHTFGADMETGETVNRPVLTVDTMLDLIRNLFPPNLVQATMQQYHTILVLPPNSTNDVEYDLYKWKIESGIAHQTNILGLVVVSIVVGIALAVLADDGVYIANIFHQLMNLSMKITHWVIWFSPVGILFLVMAKVVAIDDFVTTVGQLGLYFCTVLVGLLIQGLIVLPLLFVMLTHENPFKFLGNLGQALATAFGTASSSATLPITIKCLEEKCGVDPRVARFVLPIGAAINMDGTALYEAVAAIFIAQVRNVPLTIGSYFAISITATAASIGAAGIPHAGLVTMIMVLDTVGLPAEDVSMILAVDWLLDRCRTTVNVIGDSFGAGIVYFRSKDEL